MKRPKIYKRKPQSDDTIIASYLGLMGGILIAVASDQSRGSADRRRRAAALMSRVSGPEKHWEMFKPHCPQIVGVPCPPECHNYMKPRLDGCHVCDCLHPKKTREE